MNVLRMRSAVSGVLVASVIIMVQGCSAVGATTMLNDGIVPGTPVFYGVVKVFSSRDIGRPYEEMGSIAVAVNAEVSGDELVRRMQQEAAKIGADAIVAYEQWGTTVTGVAIRYPRP